MVGYFADKMLIAIMVSENYCKISVPVLEMTFLFMSTKCQNRLLQNDEKISRENCNYIYWKLSVFDNTKLAILF